MALPTGTVTLLFTDIEGSTALLHELGDLYLDVLAQHHEIVRKEIAAFDGVEVKTEGDSFFVAFEQASAAANACLEMQRALAAHTWPHGRAVRVRMGLHTGPVTVIGDDDYAGITVHEAARINAAGHGGQVLASSATVEAINDAGGLAAGITWLDLGRHVLKDFPAPRQLYQLAHEELPATFPPPRTLTARDHNLPAIPASLVGRSADIADLQRLLSGEARLVTVTGAGGLGKTRLALETAWTLLGRFREGAWLVDLSVVIDPAQVETAIADALRVRDQPGVPLRESIIERLGAGPMLLLLDNFEHLLDGVTVVGELLASCPALVILATSREALRLRGEHEVLLDGLATDEAVELFSVRARAARRDVQLDEHVMTLCDRLDGMPLAIELAAARVRTHTVEQLVSAMDDALDLLAEGERDLPKRQQAMRAAIAWSVDQLSAPEASVFRTLAVFRGGATVEAIDAVYGAPGGASLESLRDKSLVRFVGDRFSMLEPIRQYAYEQLRADAAELVRTTDAHAAWYCALAEAAEPQLITADQPEWLRRLSYEHPNLRAAWERGGGDVPLRIAASLIRFWAFLGHGSEGRRVLAKVLAANPDGQGELRAKALLGAGHLALVQGDLDEAHACLVEAVRLGDRATAANACNVLGEVARLSGDTAEASAKYQEALERSEALGDDRLIGLVRNNQGALAYGLGDPTSAAAHWREAAAAAERLGDQQSLLRPVSNLGLALLTAGDPAGAESAFERSLVLARSLGDRAAEASALLNLGVAASRLDDHVAARDHLRAALPIYEQLGAKRDIANTLMRIAQATDSRSEAIDVARRSRALFGELGDTSLVQQLDSLLDFFENVVED